MTMLCRLNEQRIPLSQKSTINQVLTSLKVVVKHFMALQYGRNIAPMKSCDVIKTAF